MLHTALLKGRRVLITGAARGLGLTFAKATAQAGARVVIADINADAVTQSACELQEAGLDVQSVVMDLADPDAIAAAAKDVEVLLGGLDGLVNNAAVTNSGGVNGDELAIGTWDQVMQVNVRGTWLMTCACLPMLKASTSGAVVNLASDTALWGAPKLMAYTASKGAVLAMTRSLARELGEHNITVNAIAPGLVVVEATEYVPQQRHDHYQANRAIKRQQMPEDVCGAVLFALSDLSRFITGQTLPVNGGFVMP